jgi:hypothetical protein
MNGVAWFTALILASTFSALTAGLGRMGVSAPVALAAGVTASVVGALHALPRPHILTWLLFTLLVLVLEEYRHTGRRRGLVVLPLLMLAWANLHGAFITGLMVVLFYGVGAAMERDGRRVVTLLGLLAILFVISWINPAGTQLMGHSIGYLRERLLVDMTVEYQSPNFHLMSTWPFAALLLLSLLLVWGRQQKFTWTALVLLGGWTAFALYSARNIPLYAIVTVVLLAPAVDDLIGDEWAAVKHRLTWFHEMDRLSQGWVWAVASVALLVSVEFSGSRLDVRQAGNDFNPSVFPIAAVDAFNGSPPEGNMFNHFTWGGYLLYRLWPTKRVFIDGQTDFYGEALTREYLKVEAAEPGWETVLDRYDVRWIIVPVNSPLAIQLNQSLAWSAKYKDNTTGVWIRK